jgi:hypothetical protein
MAKKIVVKQRPEKENEIPTEIMAESIKAIADGVIKLRSGRLNDRALFLLIKDAAPRNLTLADIRATLDGIASLEAAFLHKPTAKK